jgi:hypothetical protein
MTKLIAILFIVAALYGGWELFLYWDKVKHEEEVAKKQAAAEVIIDGSVLPGLPQKYESSLQAAQKQGLAAFKNWLKTYGGAAQDPRKAWIELDYCVLVAREDPAEARRVFAQVKNRTPSSSPVWPRIKQLEKTYD